MMVRGVEGMGVLRADYVYSYPASAGHPRGAFECRVCVVQDFWKGAFDGRPALLIATYLLCAAVCATITLTRRRQLATRAISGTALVLLVALTSQFWVVMLTEGASDLVKHMVGANFTLALVVVLTLAALCACAVRDPQDVPPPAAG
ncbi:hypothetical protein AB2L27_12525 [Kineococcus sp. LSe6-4]|uniref:Uncharacterized protein n=1 Tax=Kineococcus halophytocola TaxID=3234027 RepID=A0ABV4H2N8_9ACTN